MNFFDRGAPLLRLLNAETAHRATIAGLKMIPATRQRRFDAILTSHVAGLKWLSPVGLAAGFDKDAEVASQMLKLGFGFVEVGSITPRPQAGNPRPRLFRLSEDEAVINRMGFNNRGADAAFAKLSVQRVDGILGVNIGANKDSTNRIEDYVLGVGRFSSVADYLTVNVSSPNTPGLRALQDVGALADLLAAIGEARGAGAPPIFLKLAPDLDATDADAIAKTVAGKIDALIIGNTTISRPPLASRYAGEAGGLSGRPLAPLARATLALFRRATGGGIPLIAAGGIDSAEEAFARIRGGASLVQLYSAMVYQGPGVAREMADGLAALLRRDGFASLAEAVGADPL